MKKTKIKMNKPLYLGMLILYISRTLMYEFWYDYIKPKYQDKAKLCYMGIDSFVIQIKTSDFTKTLPMMLNNGLTHLTMTKMIKYRFQQVRTKN